MNKSICEVFPSYYDDVHFTNSPFLEICSNEYLDVCMQYPILNMSHAITRCFMRIEVLEKLKEAHAYLPAGYRFKILDAWRSFALQEELYEKYSLKVVALYHLDGCSQEEKDKTIRKFVSIPIKDPIFPPVHTTGGAIDLTLIDSNGDEVDMGSSFDEISDRSHLNYYEGTNRRDIIQNRRILYNAMIRAGFSNLPSEWWHYDYGDGFWGYYTKQPAMYQGVFSIDEILSQVAQEPSTT